MGSCRWVLGSPLEASSSHKAQGKAPNIPILVFCLTKLGQFGESSWLGLTKREPSAASQLFWLPLSLNISLGCLSPLLICPWFYLPFRAGLCPGHGALFYGHWTLFSRPPGHWPYSLPCILLQDISLLGFPFSENRPISGLFPCKHPLLSSFSGTPKIQGAGVIALRCQE